MRKLNVFLRENPASPVLVGTLAETDNKQHYFEYNENFLKNNHNISPFKLQFTRGLQENKDTYPRESFGVFNDSLPDSWGFLLMDRFFRKHGRNIRDITLIDRLAYIGSRGMGALAYEPAENMDFVRNNLLDLYKLSENSLAVLTGKTEDILPVLAKAGGSPGGARPKILAGFDGNRLISGESDLPEGFKPWMIKFRSVNDFRDAGKIEYVYAQMARESGLNVSEFRLFYDNKGNSYFGTKRFDREDHGRRIHTHTLGNLIHADFRIPSLDYEMLFKVCSRLTENYEDVKMCFRLMVFNVLSHNRDDHGKNFAFQMNSKGRWSFAPAYDLMFAYGPGGEHTTTIAGEGRSPTIKNILKLASLVDISGVEANGIIKQVKSAISQWKKLASDAKIQLSDINLIQNNISLEQYSL
jgi:serine/threonine-protein kinase HipA